MGQCVKHLPSLWDCAARPGWSLSALSPATALLLQPAQPAVRVIAGGLLAYGKG